MSRRIRCHHETCTSGEFCDEIESRCSPCTAVICGRHEIPAPCIHHCSSSPEGILDKIQPGVRPATSKVPKRVRCFHETCTRGEFCDENEGRCSPCTAVICRRHEIPEPCRHHCSSGSEDKVHPGFKPTIPASPQRVRCYHETCTSGEFCDEKEGRCSPCTGVICRRREIPGPCRHHCSSAPGDKVHPAFKSTTSAAPQRVRCYHETCTSGEFCDENEGRCSPCTGVICGRHEIPEPCRHHCSSAPEESPTTSNTDTGTLHVRHKDDKKSHRCCRKCCAGEDAPQSCRSFCHEGVYRHEAESDDGTDSENEHVLASILAISILLNAVFIYMTRHFLWERLRYYIRAVVHALNQDRVDPVREEIAAEENTVFVEQQDDSSAT